MTQAQDHPNPNKADNDGSASSSLTPQAGIWGLQGAIIFALCCFFVGYSIPLSLFLGAITGAAISALVNWWQLDDETADSLQVSFSDEEIYGLRKRNRRTRQKQYLDVRNRYRSRRNRASLTGLFFQTGVAQLSPPDRPQTGSAQSADSSQGDKPGSSENE
jgi:hypothetical protein